MPYLTINEQRLFYTQQRGVAGGPALVLVHGAGGTHLNWPPQLRRMPDTAVYALDLPGHGRSQKPGHTTVTAYADDVLAFIHALELDNVILAGHSMGGAIAQTVALSQSPRVIGLVLVGTGARLRVADAILEGILMDFEAAVTTITQYAWVQGAPADLVAQGKRLLSQADPAVMHDDFTACNHFDVMGQLDQIRLPTLVIGGTADQLTPLKYGRYLAEHIPNAQLVTIEGGGHMMALEQPDKVAAAIRDFVGRIY